ncbi:MAG: 2Fe-2S iron-sulfur cluster binding domain-containing protein, partial [Chloroflexi bacterium]|nr:2Fe-2S iron-sulfur cluster binding domain-containing protein [Chloroflexota bacterium]
MSEQAATKVTINFKSHDKVTRVPPGMSIFNAANWIGLPIDSTCGARGTCGKCKVQILQGHNGSTAADQKVFSTKELADGWRLSCRAEVHQDVVCDVPRLMGNPKAALMGFGRHVILDPNVHKVALQLALPSLEDQRSDVTRIVEALADEGFVVQVGLPVLRQLPQVLREAEWRVTAVIVGDDLIGIEPGDTTSRSYGLAFDIGTTTVVGALMDLRNGTPLAVRSTLNGQAIHGADVISRISYAMMNEDGLEQLTTKIIQSMNTLIEQLLVETAVSASELYEVVVAGNATMIHLLLGIDPTAIGVEPFIPTFDDALEIKAADIGLRIHP